VGGWEMPVQYTGIVEEHRTTRGAVGLFDVSHMGEFEVEGPGALAALQHLSTNDVASLQVGHIQYSVLCYDTGTLVDDLTVYRVGDERYMITVNAGNIDKDWAHVTKSTEHVENARWRNASEGTGLIAVQGPKAEALVGRLADHDETTTPLEAGLGWVVKPAKGEFIGREALEKVRAEGVRRRLVGIEMIDKAVARHGYPVKNDGRAVGIVTSGSYGPSVDKYIGIA